jgi:hypothetical protein
MTWRSFSDSAKGMKILKLGDSLKFKLGWKAFLTKFDKKPILSSARQDDLYEFLMVDIASQDHSIEFFHNVSISIIYKTAFAVILLSLSVF